MSIVKYFFLSAFFILFFSNVVAASDQYQTQLEFGVLEMEYDGGLSSSGKYIGGLHYFDPIENVSGPYMEADFLNNQTGVFFAVGNEKLELSSVSLDGPFYLFGVSLVPENRSYLFNVIYNQTELKENIYKIESNSISLEFGYYLDSMTGIKLSASERETEYTNFVTDAVDTTEINILYKKLLELDDGSYLNVKGELEINDSTAGDWNQVNALLDYYPDRTLGFGVEFGFRSGDDKNDDGTELQVEISKFINPQFFLTAELSQYDSEGSSDHDEMLFVIGYRL